MPTTFLEGLLSGLSHPAIGIDHLAFLVTLGVVAAMMPAGIAMIASFVAAATVGELIHAANVELPLSEQLVAVSVIAAGLLIALGLGARQLIWLPFAGAAGLLHGYAFGEEILGADGIVIAAYLTGVVIVCSVIALGVMQFASKVLALSDAGSRPLRVAGALIGLLGIVLLAQLIRNG
jgi:urease accessory protein